MKFRTYKRLKNGFIVGRLYMGAEDLSDCIWKVLPEKKQNDWDGGVKCVAVKGGGWVHVDDIVNVSMCHIDRDS